MMQAYSGLMSLLGEDGRPPVRVPASIIDMGAGMWSVIGILAALAGARPHRQGRGGRYLALRDRACLDEHLSRRLSREPRIAGAARLRGRYDRAVSGLCRRGRVHDGGRRQRQSVPPARRRARPPRPRRGPALSLATRTGSSTARSWSRSCPTFSPRSRERNGRGCSMRQGIPNGPINTLDQVVADAQTQALGIIQTSGQRTRPCRPAAVVRRRQAGIRESGAGARRRQREARPYGTG